MVIQWLGHSSFLITAEDGTKIITDPYEPDAFGGGLTYGSIDIAPDVVTVSHDHADHSYLDGLPNHFEVVNTPGTKTIKGIEFTGLATFHDSEQGSVRGRNTIFIIDLDGVKVCHLGDLGHPLSEDIARKLRHVDVLFIPVGGYFTIDAKAATRTLDQIKPKIVIPMHYKTPKCQFPIATVDEFLSGKKNVKRVESSEYEVTKEKLPADTEIVVLQYAL